MAEIMIKVPGYRCERCSHEWVPRGRGSEPRVCPKCGRGHTAEALFCQACGTRLVEG